MHIIGNSRMSNECLSGLPPTVLSLLRPHLTEVTLGECTILWGPKEPSGDIYFPLSGIISIGVAMAEGECVAVGGIGREAMAGSTFDRGHFQPLTRGSVQIGGT